MVYGSCRWGSGDGKYDCERGRIRRNRDILCTLETITRYTVQAFYADRGVGIGRHVFRQGECQLVGGERGNIVQHLSLDLLGASEFADVDGCDVTLFRHDGRAGCDVLLLDCGGQLGRVNGQFV